MGDKDSVTHLLSPADASKLCAQLSYNQTLRQLGATPLTNSDTVDAIYPEDSTKVIQMSHHGHHGNGHKHNREQQSEDVMPRLMNMARYYY